MLIPPSLYSVWLSAGVGWPLVGHDDRRRVRTVVEIKWIENFEFFERSFIEQLLFSDLPSTDGSPQDRISEIYCVAGNAKVLSAQATKSIHQDRSSSVFVLSDEQLLHNYAMHRNSRLIFRNYFQPKWWRRHVFTLPLGYNPGFVGIHDRRGTGWNKEYDWAFVGEIKGPRQSIINRFSEVTPGFVYSADSFNDPHGLSSDKLFEVYAKSHFVLCPFGNKSPDSFRVMEALEAGAIPVTVEFLKTDHNRLIFGDHPFIVGKDWADAASIVLGLIESPQELEKRHRQVFEWYVGYKTRLKRDLAQLLLGKARDALESEQFAYQRRASLNPVIHWKYLNHYSRPLRELRFNVKRLRDLGYLKVKRFLGGTSKKPKP